jgi:hypothetical protein
MWLSAWAVRKTHTTLEIELLLYGEIISSIPSRPALVDDDGPGTQGLFWKMGQDALKLSYSVNEFIRTPLESEVLLYGRTTSW